DPVARLSRMTIAQTRDESQVLQRMAHALLRDAAAAVAESSAGAGPGTDPRLRVALAEVAARRGAEVTLVAGPVERPTPAGVVRIDVETAEQLLAAMDDRLRAAPVELVAMVAAVADLTPRQTRAGKLDKADLPQAMEAGAWVEGVDVLATLCQRHGARAFFLGFGAQTVDDGQDVPASLREAGQRKLARKGCHAIFVNRVGVADTGFASATNTGLLVGREGEPVEDAGPPMAKAALAGWLLDRLHARVGGARS
ncbi:MAG: phosphopantothenoylcysteine decarboxylase, partial [Myxococcales bacterium]|nr:phosphopantothenoylcysteine decarboxylase [Myxococcales bacterium]